jgi:magnesium transporter
VIRVSWIHPDGRVECGSEELLGVEPPPGVVRWIDLLGEQHEVGEALAAMGFHPLAVEDAFTSEHQPKVEELEGCLFVIVRGIDANREDDELHTLKLAAFLEPARLVTYHRAPMRSVAAVLRRLEETGHLPPGGLPHLLYQLFDQLVERYFPLLDQVAAEIEELEDQILDEPRPAQLDRLQKLRRRLSTLRRVMLPHRQVFNHLASTQNPLVGDQRLYFRDVYDNVFRLNDAVDQQRDLLASAKETYLSVVGQRTNEVMKVLTLFSAILLPLTFIAGLYGMNFQHIPELGWRWGYYGVLGVMGLVAVGMLLWFRRRRWL